MISLRASAKKIAEANSKIIERPQQLFAEAKIGAPLMFSLGPFHLIYTPPYGREFLRGVEKVISEGLCASASFDLCVFSSFDLCEG